MQKTETVQGVKGSFYVVTLNKQEQSVQRIEQFWSPDGIRVNYARESELYIARDKRWLYLDHVRKEIRYTDDEEMISSPLRFSHVDENRLFVFVQSLFRQAGIKVSAPKKWSGSYFGVSAVFTELRTTDGDLCFQLARGTLDRWTLPLRLILVTSDEDMFVRDALSVRKQPISRELFTLPRDYKLVR